jgi:hypothetical protein
MKRLWFRAKDYGWGWTPATWEGWAVTAAWLAFLILIVKDTGSYEEDGVAVLLRVILPTWASIVALLLVCWKTGEKPEWRWGGKPVRKPKEPPRD